MLAYYIYCEEEAYIFYLYVPSPESSYSLIHNYIAVL